jgi:hypothetical protein
MPAAVSEAYQSASKHFKRNTSLNVTLLNIRPATKLMDSSASIAYVDALAAGLALQLALQELSNVSSQLSASRPLGRYG